MCVFLTIYDLSFSHRVEDFLEWCYENRKWERKSVGSQTGHGPFRTTYICHFALHFLGSALPLYTEILSICHSVHIRKKLGLWCTALYAMRRFLFAFCRNYLLFDQPCKVFKCFRNIFQCKVITPRGDIFLDQLRLMVTFC